MSNTDFEDQEDPDFDDTPSRQVSNLSQDDVNGQVSSYLNNAPRQVVAQSDANPDDAARSIDLSSATGVPATAINGDLDGFEAKHKAFLAAQLVRGNPQLTAYVNSHPLAASVSNDDYANLDQFSSGASGLAAWLHEARVATGRPLEPIRQGIAGAAGGAVEAFNEGAGGDAPIHNPLDFLVRSASGLMNVPFGLASGGASGAAAGFGASPQVQEQAGRTAQGLVESEFGRGEIAPEIEQGTAAGLRFKSAAEAARPWTSEGLEPPTGLHPAIDELKAQGNAQALQALDQNLADAQASLTKERSPELFQQFVSQHFGDAMIGIHGDAVSALYGDEVPSPDDGKLGFVPNIAEQLDLARATGADVHVPVSDWIGKVDPALAQGLHDDIRMWPGGITAREAAEPIPPKATVDSPLAQVRASGDLEPMYAVGDRKVALQKVNELPVMPGSELAYHNFDMLDENGQKVGELELVPDPATKTLHVQMINGVGGMYSNSFGPSLVRDLMRQLKSEYPDYTTITGHRVTGARFANAPTYNGEVEFGSRDLEFPKIALDAPTTIESLNDFHAITDAAWQKTGPGMAAQVKPSAIYNTYEAGIVRQVNKVLDSMIGDRAARIPSHEIYAQSIQDYPLGAFIQHKDRAPQLLYNLLDPDAVGVARHEGIHFLYREGFFKPEEWRTLTDAAENEGWLSRYGIGDRYGNLDYHQQVEEAIAEGYREWAGAKDEARADSPVGRIFQKLQELWEGLKRRLTALTGQELGWKDLFEATDTGEVAQREGEAAPITQGAFDSRQAFALDNDHFDSLRASGAGLDIDSYRKIQAQIAKRYEEDITKAQARAEKEQARKQGKAWKDNQADVRREVTETIRQRPDVAADLFVGSGELYGNKLRQRYTLRADDLTPEQKASLPDHYVSHNGLPVDEVARMFGYQSGDQMVEGLANYQSQKGDLSPQEALRQTIKQETDRQMQARYGSLDENVMDAAKDQALSETNLNILAEETYAAGIKAGTPIDVDAVKSWAKESFGKMELRNVNSDRLIAQMAGHGRNAERALIGGDPATALQFMQKKLMSAVLASEARKLEKSRDQFSKQIRPYGKKLNPAKRSSIDPGFDTALRTVLGQLGERNGSNPFVLKQYMVQLGFKDLADFLAKTEKENELVGLELPVPDFLTDPNFNKPTNQLTVDEFNAVRDGVSSLITVGKGIYKVELRGEKEDRADLLGRLKDQIKDKFDALKQTINPKTGDATKRTIKQYVAASTSLETLFSRFDSRDPHGLFTKTFTYPMASAANLEDRLQREFATDYKALSPIKDQNKLLGNSPLKYPDGRPVTDLNRGNLAVIISNMGNDYNFKTFANGWNVDPNVLWGWVMSHSTVEDFDRAFAMSKMFDKAKGMSDTVYQNLYGRAPPNIEVRPFVAHGKSYPGWYHPIIGDPARSAVLNKMPELEKQTQFWPSTSNPYVKRRTGAQQVVDLTYDSIPARFQTMFHDISFREPIYNLAKLVKDTSFRNVIKSHYGPEYMDEMDSWLQRVAGNQSHNSSAMQTANKISNYLRQNIISTQIAFNAGTVEKHGITALAMSARELDANLFKSVPKMIHIMGEVGLDSFRHAVMDLFGKDPNMGESLMQFIKQNAEEIQRRDRNYQDTMMGQQQIMSGNSTLRNTISQWGAKLVAFSDIASAAPLWLAKYREEMAANGIHGPAVDVANASVRRAHGSTAITNLPRIATGDNPLTPWMTSLYGFMGTSMQRRIEMVQDLNDIYKLGIQGDINGAWKKVPQVLSSAAVYVIWTGVVENAVENQFQQDRRPLWEKLATFGFGTAAQTLIGFRDLVSDVTHGSEGIGLTSSPIHDTTSLFRDLKKHDPLGREHAGKLAQDAITEIGDLYGLGPKHVGTMVRYGIDAFSGFQKPHSAGDVYRGLVSGSQRERVVR